MTPSQLPALFSLPMYGNELGRLPIYGQFNFSDSLGTHIPVQNTNSNRPANLHQLIFLSNLLSGNPEGVSSGPPSSSFANTAFETDNGFSNQPLCPDLNKPDSNGIPILPLQDNLDFATFFQAGGSSLNNARTSSDPSSNWPGFNNVIPAMDDDTLTVWSTAPRNLEYVLHRMCYLIKLHTDINKTGWTNGIPIFRALSK